MRHFRYFPRLCWDPSIWGGIQKISQTPFQIIRSIKALKLFLVLEQFDRRGRCIWAGACETKLLPAAGDFDQLVPKSRSTNPSCPVTVMGRSKQVIINRYSFGIRPCRQANKACLQRAACISAGFSPCERRSWLQQNLVRNLRIRKLVQCWMIANR